MLALQPETVHYVRPRWGSRLRGGVQPVSYRPRSSAGWVLESPTIKAIADRCRLARWGGDQVLGPQSRFDGPDPGRLVILRRRRLCRRALTVHRTRTGGPVRGRDLEWSVWDTMVHVNDDLYFYAAQVLLAEEHDYICFELAADAHANPQRLLEALAVHARLLAGVVASAEPTSRAHHVYGVSDPGGFAAMGVVEALVHTYDAVHGLDSSSTWRPPDDLAAAVLDRLFPHTAAGHGRVPR